MQGVLGWSDEQREAQLEQVGLLAGCGGARKHHRADSARASARIHTPAAGYILGRDRPSCEELISRRCTSWLICVCAAAHINTWRARGRVARRRCRSLQSTAALCQRQLTRRCRSHDLTSSSSYYQACMHDASWFLPAHNVQVAQGARVASQLTDGCITATRVS
jgi:hypothetical protein